MNYLGGDDYRVDSAAGRVDMRMQFLGQYERIVTCQGRRYRVTASTQGPRLLVEVDGLPHVIDRDDGGQVRSPSPAFVVAVLVGAGDTVRAGDPLVVTECMKMENTITAPYAGTVTSVLADVNTQVDAGAPLVRLQAPDHAEPGPVSAPIDLAGLAGIEVPSAARPAGTGAAPGFAAGSGTAWAEDLNQESYARLRAYLLGYDLGDEEARDLSRQREVALAALPPAHSGPAVRGAGTPGDLRRRGSAVEACAGRRHRG